MSQPIQQLLALLESEDKKRLVLKFIESQLKAKSSNPKNVTSSLKKQTKPHFESPSARFRRRALEKMYQEEAGLSKPSNENMARSNLSGTCSNVESLVPLNEILTGVIAFVDVTSGGEDRSFPIKALLSVMGATVRDVLTKDVTHIIFKDGSYTTYEKAKYLKAHFVSILWIQASKTQRVKVPEKHYPALGSATYNQDMSLICTELQQEYNNLIREEYSASLATGAALPSAQTIIDRRRTLAVSNPTNSFNSFSLSQCSTPTKRNSNRRGMSSLNSQRIFSDDEDSDSGAVIDGHIVEKMPCNDAFDLTDMDLSDNITSFHGDEFKENANSLNAATAITPDSLYNVQTPKICPGSQRFNSATPVNNLLGSLTPDDLYTKTTLKVVLKSQNLNITNNILALPVDDSVCDKNATELNKTRNETSILKLNQSKILSKNSTKEPPVEKSSSMSSLRLSSDKSKEKSTESNMSSLRLSSEHNVESTNSGSAEKSKVGVNKPSTTVKRKPVNPDKPENNDDIESEENPPKRMSISTVSEKKNHSDNSSPEKVKEIKIKLNKLSSLSSNEVISEGVIASEGLPSTPVIAKKKKKGRRKLYNPEDSFSRSMDDDAERLRAKLKAKEAETNNKTDLRDNMQRNITKSLPNKRKLRKLYNPSNDSFNRSVDDDTERVKAKLKAQEADENNTVPKVNPQQNITLSSKMKEIVTSMDLLDKILRKNDFTRQPKKAKKHTVIDEDRDEQKELLKEIMQDRNKEKATPAKLPTTEERRKSLRLQAKTAGKEQNDITVPKERSGVTPYKLRSVVTPRKLHSQTTPLKEQNVVTPNANRRSSIEFQTKLEMSANRRLKIDKIKKPSIVCSKLHRDQIHEFNSITRKLGGFVTENEVSKKTTHLVLGEPKRTINFLKAIAMGCWVLKYEWLLQSSKIGKWLPEEDFEETSISPIVQQSRLQRQAFGPSYSMDIFKECGYIYIEQNTVPKCSDLRELILLCKGQVTNIKRNAAIVIGQPQRPRSPGEIVVRESWVLDSITQNKKLSFKKYLCKI